MLKYTFVRQHKSKVAMTCFQSCLLKLRAREGINTYIYIYIYKRPTDGGGEAMYHSYNKH